MTGSLPDIELRGIDGDEALKALELEEGETITHDEETNRKLLRKIGNFQSVLMLIIRLAYNAPSLYCIRSTIS